MAVDRSDTEIRSSQRDASRVQDPQLAGLDLYVYHLLCGISNMSDKDTLIGMGFESARVECEVVYYDESGLS